MEKPAQRRNTTTETVSAAAIAASGPDSPGDGSRSSSLSPALDPMKKTRFIEERD